MMTRGWSTTDTWGIAQPDITSIMGVWGWVVERSQMSVMKRSSDVSGNAAIVSVMR